MYVGVIVDESLSWNSHISYVTSRVYQTLLKITHRYKAIMLKRRTVLILI